MKRMIAFGYAIVALTAMGWLFAQRAEAAEKLSTETLIADLSCADGVKRAAATKEIFQLGKAALPDLKKAGAIQVAPTGGTVDNTRRLDMVYSVLEGFPPNPPRARAGYKNDGFGLHVENGTTEDEFQKICRKYGCNAVGNFNAESKPSCYVHLGPGQTLEAVIPQILSAEPKVKTINLNYFER